MNWKEYLTFSRSQQSGIIILIILIILAIVVPSGYKLYKQKTTSPDLSFIDNFQFQDTAPVNNYSKPKTDSLFNFDPNTISPDALVKLGLTEKTARTIIKYREAGGRFEQPSDLSKIYHLPDSQYLKLLPYIKIATVNKVNKSNKSPAVEIEKNVKPAISASKPIEIIELNSADSATLVSLPAIGPVIAMRIISYRQFLGGFYSVSQLKEVYNLPPETYELIKNRLTVDTASIVKINLNRVEFKQLNKHPYLSYQQIKAILSYRKTMGKFTQIGDVLKYKLVDSVNYCQLKPYLTVN